MNGIQLKPMPRYQRTEFDEDRGSGVSDNNSTSTLEGTVIFPPDITKGFANPNSEFDVVFKSTEVIGLNNQDHDPCITGSPLHPMVHITRPSSKTSTSGARSSLRFLKGKVLRPFGFDVFPDRGSSSSSSSRRASFLLWNRMTFLEKSLFLFCVLLSVTVIFLTLSLIQRTHKVVSYSITQNVSNVSTKEYCVTPACVTVASSIINAMDTSVDPCHDFYSYSCGGWVKANPLPDGKSIWGSFHKLWQENQLVMKNVLDSDVLTFNDSKHSAEHMARTYYKACLDTNETTDARGSEPLMDFIQEIGGWNISGTFEESSWDFQRTLQTLHNKYNRGGGLLNWAVGADEKNSTQNVLQLDQANLILPTRDYYLNRTAHEKVINAYLSYMTKVGVLLGGNESETRAQMEQVLEFETRIANITIPFEDRRDEEKMYHKMQLKEIQVLAPFLNWTEYFDYAFHQINVTIGEEEPIVIYTPDYLSNLSSLIQEYKSTQEGRITLANYLVWSVAQTLTSTLSKPFRDASKILRKALIGSEGLETPWRYCVSDTNNVMGFALGSMFVKSVFKGRSKELAESMIREVKDAFKNNLPHLKWMDPETITLAKEKADAITDMIGFPDFILDPDKLDEKYEGLEFEEDKYFENNIKVSMYAFRKNLEKKMKPANKTEWEMTPPAVNAYYAPLKNQIVFPAGILQAPFYDLNYPKSLNFGAMGVVMGHELTHAFDDQGRDYDKEGNLHRWWRDDTIWHFVEKIQCFVDQYSNYSVNGDQLNGKQTLGENIADNGGLKAAFHAYEAWMSHHEEELPLPGVNLTNRQLFFLGFAQVWCSVNTPEALKLQILQDPHSPSVYRVIGTLSNSNEFAKEFSCKPGTPMNPEKKCVVW